MSLQKSILSLIKERKWPEVIAKSQIASTHEIIEKDPSNFNATPLHQAISLHAPCDVVRYLIFHGPEATKMKENRNGYLPLHAAVRYKSSLDVISLLIKSYKSSVSMRDKHYWSSIHIACYFNPDHRLIDLLLSADPAGAKMKTRQDLLPLHIACRRKATSKVVQILLKSYLQGCREKNGDGWLPLHLAIWHEAPEEVIIDLIQAYPEATKEVTSSSEQTPLSLYWSNCFLSKNIIMLLIDPYILIRKDEERDIGIIHHTLHFPQHIPNLLTCILQDFDDDATNWDCEGRLPLHVAIEMHSKMDKQDDVWKKIFKRNPKAIFQPNCITSLYPFMMACMRSDLDLTFELLRLCPNIFEEIFDM